MGTDREQLIKELIEEFPGIKGIRKSEELGWSAGAIFLGNAAEGGTINGERACDYYAHDPNERTYIMGVHKELHTFLNKNGWFAEPQDSGTWLAYE